MQQRTVGGVQVNAIGLGGMPMPIERRSDNARSVATIYAALDAGITLIDTVDAYHLGAAAVGHGADDVDGGTTSRRRQLLRRDHES